MTTDKQRFIRFMKKYGFDITQNFIGTFPLIPSHQKTTKGNHVLIKNITFCLFDGVNTKEGKLGCVTLYYSGVERKKYYKTAHQAEILQKAFCPKNATAAIETFENWHKKTKQIRNTWKTII